MTRTGADGSYQGQAKYCWTDRRGHAECPALAHARTRPTRPTLASAISRRTQWILGLKILEQILGLWKTGKMERNLSSEERKVAFVQRQAGARKFSPTSASTLRAETFRLAHSGQQALTTKVKPALDRPFGQRKANRNRSCLYIMKLILCT